MDQTGREKYRSVSVDHRKLIYPICFWVTNELLCRLVLIFVARGSVNGRQDELSIDN